MLRYPKKWWVGTSVLLILVLVILGSQWDNPTNHSKNKFATRDSIEVVLKEMDARIAAPEKPLFSTIEGDWNYAKGLGTESLHSFELKRLDFSTTTRLPHRILEPNTALWYKKEIRFEKMVVWAVNADDGCQVFLNDKQVKQYRPGGYFLMPISEKPVTVYIRVLNNAMKGGLRAIHEMEKEDFDNYTAASEDYYCMKKSIQFYLNHARDLKIPIELASTLKGVRNCKALLNVLSDYPVLSPPVVSFAKNLAKVAIRSSADQEALCLYGLDGLHFYDTIKFQPNDGKLSFSFPKFPPDTKVFYRVFQGKTSTGVYSFSTPAAHYQAFSFTAWGDSQGGWEVFKKHVSQEGFASSDFFIGLGDLVDNGSLSYRWDEFTACLEPILQNKPVILVPGNHDYDGYYDDLYPANYHHVNPTHNFIFQTWGNAAFLSLDLNEVFPLGFDKEQQYRFSEVLESKEWEDAQWRFLLCHQPIYAQGWEGYHGEPFLKELLEQLFQQEKIDFFLSGHTHDYERLTRVFGDQTTHFIITGGGGGTVESYGSLSQFPQMDTLVKAHHYCKFKVDYNQISMNVYNQDGKLIETKDFKKPLKGIDK